MVYGIEGMLWFGIIGILWLVYMEYLFDNCFNRAVLNID